MCPVCKMQHMMKTQIFTGEAIKTVWVPELLYQRSYPREKEYLSQRCEGCYNKAIKKEAKRKVK